VFFHYSAGAVEESNLVKVIKAFESADVKTVILGPVPTWNYKVPERMWQYKNDLVNLDLNQSYEQFLDLNSDALSELTDSVAKLKVPYFNLSMKLCTPKCLYSSSDGHPYYWDEGHLTLAGAKILGPILSEALKTVIKD
jgi:lysophospholipase L1-like esterase